MMISAIARMVQMKTVIILYNFKYKSTKKFQFKKKFYKFILLNYTGTNACLNGRFKCQNRFYEKKLISTNKVKINVLMAKQGK